MHPSTTLLLLGSITLSLAQNDCDVVYQPPTEREAPTINKCLSNANVPLASIGSDAFNFETNPYNSRVQYTPAALVLPTTVEHVQAAVSCVARRNIRVSAKSGGHSYAAFGLGGEDGHLIVDFKYMHNVTVDPTTKLATLQPGCRLGNVA